MPYYGQGDYYAAGDPGLFSTLGGLAKRALGAGVGFLTGGAVGAVRGAVNPPFSRGIAAPLFPPSIEMPSPLIGPGMNMIRGGTSMPVTATNGVPPSGYHLNKSGYFLKSGEYVAPRSRYVRNRSRNNANGRALRRSISRVSGFNKLVKSSRKSLRSLAKV